MAVDNTDNEALSYAWKLYGPGENLLDSGSKPQFELFPTVNGANITPITTECRITVTVGVGDPTRSKTALVWTGYCTYYATRLG